MPLSVPASSFLVLVLATILPFLSHVQAFSSPSRLPSQHSPYDRRPPTIPPSSPATEDRGSNLYRPLNPLLGPGSRVAIDGADAPGESNTLARLITKKLFKSQMRPYLLVPSMDKVPTGLGFDQYKGLTRYLCTAAVDEKKGGDGKIPLEIDGLVLCSEMGYTSKQVRELLERVEDEEGDKDKRETAGGTGEKKGLKRVVMLSSLGVIRREDVIWKLKQFGVDLEKRYQAEQELISQAQRRGFTYTLIRVGPLRGGGGDEGLGFEFYDHRSSSKFQTLLKNPLSVLDDKDEHFDATKRGFTFSYEDNLVFGDTGRILAAETMIKALGSAHVEDVALSLVSEQGRTWPNFQVAPWDLF